MTLLEQIQQAVNQLPPDQQRQVLDFVTFLRQKSVQSRPTRKRPLREHPAFGSWQERGIDALQYQESLRSEWDHRP